ncbi:hypothetical protein [Chitinophaga caseinilytica]|uniref:SIS domain-containing protein n=1 Tax=Chitinophaga caseinilytica TaxID=2267521 RepID=A0ABZ2ZAA0_9BACT
MAFTKVTEQPSQYRHLETMTVQEVLTNINNEDKTVPLAVEKAIPQITKLTAAIADKMLAGGRLFYMGAGTSGRLGILDASECPPTYGVPQGLVVGLIAGGIPPSAGPLKMRKTTASRAGATSCSGTSPIKT